MTVLCLLLGIALVLTVMLDAFETVVLPRTVKRNIRLASMYFTVVSKLYRAIGRSCSGKLRQAVLVAFAPFVLLLLIVLWAVLMIGGFALIYWGLQLPLSSTTEVGSLPAYLYYSGVTFFTLGYGDLTPVEGVGRTFAVIEAGLGFGFLALIISYVPVIYSAFSRREVTMLLLDSKAGSDPSAAELLRRHAEAQCMQQLTPLLKDWERFAAELLESYLSFPFLSFYRSQHDNQSWLRSLTAILDTCALIEAGFEGSADWMPELRFQAKATFAMARHLVVDLAYIVDVAPSDDLPYRLTEQGWHSIRADLYEYGVVLDGSAEAKQRLKEMRVLYEPFVTTLAGELLAKLPDWIHESRLVDNWQTSAWDGARHF